MPAMRCSSGTARSNRPEAEIEQPMKAFDGAQHSLPSLTSLLHALFERRSITLAIQATVLESEGLCNSCGHLPLDQGGFGSMGDNGSEPRHVKGRIAIELESMFSELYHCGRGLLNTLLTRSMLM